MGTRIKYLNKLIRIFFYFIENSVTVKIQLQFRESFNRKLVEKKKRFFSFLEKNLPMEYY